MREERTNRLLSNALLLQVALAGVAAALALVLSGWEMAAGVAAAAAVAAADLWIIKALVHRFARGRPRSVAYCALVLAGKFPALVAAMWVLLRVFSLPALGVVIGFSTMVAALLCAALAWQRLQLEGERS